MIKKFSAYVEEQAPAQDYVPSKSEGPAKGEKDFVNQHTATKTDYVVQGQDHVFNGDIKEDLDVTEEKKYVVKTTDNKGKVSETVPMSKKDAEAYVKKHSYYSGKAKIAGVSHTAKYKIVPEDMQVEGDVEITEGKSGTHSKTS